MIQEGAALDLKNNQDTKVSDTDGKEGYEKAKDSAKRTWHNFKEVGTDRKIELLLAVAITFFAGAQWVTSCQNNASTSEQANKLITAAQMSAHSAAHNAAAAQNFAESAQSINHGISDAVGRLQDQARVTELARETSQAASKKALQATIENFRTEQRPWLVFRLTPTTPVKWEGADQWGLDLNFAIDVQNLGKTPATDVSISQPRTIISDDAPLSAPSDLLNQACDSVMQGKRVPGALIYPSVPIQPVKTHTWVPGSQVKKESARHSGLTILVAVCVSYRPTYKVDKPYRYGQVYAIGDNTSGPLPFLVRGQDVPIEHLVLRSAFTGPIID